MDFDLSPEQELLKNSVERFVHDEYEFSKRRTIIGSDEGFSRDHWKMFAELGWLGISVPEQYGGFGGSAVDVMVLMEAFGKGLVVEPFLTTVVLGAGLLREAGSEAQKSALLGRIVSGELLVAFAFAEPQARYDLHDVTCGATRTDSGWALSGAKSVVIHGPSADSYIVTARTSGGQRDKDGISLFLVPREAKGLERVDARAFTHVPVSELRFDKVELPADAILAAGPGNVAQGPEGAALGAIEKVVDEAIAAICADAVGAMEAVHGATNEYLQSRTQFGQPIGRFQVLQHRMVDMFMELEQSRSLTYLATLKLDSDTHERRRASSCAKAQIGKAGKFVGGQAVQLHGGMGMTDELNVSHYYKHLMMLDILFGNADHHLKQFARLTQ